jgi:hypothetical protein
MGCKIIMEVPLADLIQALENACTIMFSKLCPPLLNLIVPHDLQKVRVREIKLWPVAPAAF